MTPKEIIERITVPVICVGPTSTPQNTYGLFTVLQFYQNVSVYDMEHKDLYLRVDNKAHLNRELIIPKNVETQYLDMNHDTLRTNQSMIELRDQFSQ